MSDNPIYDATVAHLAGMDRIRDAVAESDRNRTILHPHLVITLLSVLMLAAAIVGSTLGGGS